MVAAERVEKFKFRGLVCDKFCDLSAKMSTDG